MCKGETIIVGQVSGKSKAWNNYRHIRMDASTETLQSIDYVHHEVHSGSFFQAGMNYTLANGDVATFVIETPTDGKQMHISWALNAIADGTTAILEDVTSHDGVTNPTPLNHNRNSSNTSSATIYKGMTDANLITPVGGTQIIGGYQDIGKGGTISRGIEEEFILKENSKYLFRYTNGVTANHIIWRFYWYEHTPKN